MLSDTFTCQTIDRLRSVYTLTAGVSPATSSVVHRYVNRCLAYVTDHRQHVDVSVQNEMVRIFDLDLEAPTDIVARLIHKRFRRLLPTVTV